MFDCKYCHSKQDMKLFVPFKNLTKAFQHDPEYKFHIKQICFDCHKFQQFMKQTPELMDSLRDSVFMDIGINDKRIPFGDPRDQ